MNLPGEALLSRLWETLVDKGMGNLLKPWQVRREGRAHVEVRRTELLALAEAERDAEDIRAGRKRLQDCPAVLTFAPSVTPRLSTLSADQRIEPTIDTRAIAEVSAREMLADSVRRQVNVAKAIIQAEESLQGATEVPPEKTIDDDWLYRWRNYAGDVSAEEMQGLWGRVLAGELKSPGSYSLRLLDFLRNISQEEAQCIARIAPFVIGSWIWRDQSEPLAAGGIKFVDLLSLQDMGVLSGVESASLKNTWESAEAGRYQSTFLSYRKALVARHDDPTKTLSLTVYLLTAIGKQIVRLGAFQPNLDYLHAVGVAMAQQGFSVTLADFVDVSDKRVRLFNEIRVGPSPEAAQGST